MDYLRDALPSPQEIIYTEIPAKARHSLQVWGVDSREELLPDECGVFDFGAEQVYFGLFRSGQITRVTRGERIALVDIDEQGHMRGYGRAILETISPRPWHERTPYEANTRTLEHYKGQGRGIRRRRVRKDLTREFFGLVLHSDFAGGVSAENQRSWDRMIQTGLVETYNQSFDGKFYRRWKFVDSYQ
jgi:hypothetical protein